MRNFFKKHFLIFSGLLVGALNGLFGGGGGMIAVPVLKKSGLEQKKAQATSIAVTLPLSIISTAVYFFMGKINFHTASAYIPMGLLGAGAGALMLKKFPDKILKRIFGAVMIISGIRILVR